MTPDSATPQHPRDVAVEALAVGLRATSPWRDDDAYTDVWAADAGIVLAALRADGWDVVRRRAYEQRVEQMAAALHRSCELEWDAIAVVDPDRLLTQHFPDAHYGRAHDLVRLIWPELDAAGVPA